MGVPQSNSRFLLPTTLSSLAARDARLKRKKLLEEVAKRRKEIYKRFSKKLRQTTASYEQQTPLNFPLDNAFLVALCLLYAQGRVHQIPGQKKPPRARRTNPSVLPRSIK